ncbi:MAG: C40 family peptidase [Spirochaetaceae bacterium]|nr:C40 family peptidase [Spirochaetaceae bacterium]
MTAFFSMLSFPALLTCSNLVLPRERDTVLCPKNVAILAENYARAYAASPTRYHWGGQDFIDKKNPARTLSIDCSGLVVNCYFYAAKEAGYELLFNDAAVADFYRKYAMPIKNPRAGDIVFMGSLRGTPTHMGIFIKREGGRVWFIDATLNLEENINGVTYRSWSETDPRINSFGRLMLKHPY